MRGIDLSHWNGSIGLDVIRDENVELDFVILKHSEGLSIRDTMYDRYCLDAHNRGLAVHGYHFYVGNVLTDSRRDMIIARMADIAHTSGGMAFIDWEREIDALNADFIFKTMGEYMRQTGYRCGLYASYSVFNRTDLFADEKTLAEHCQLNDIPIWCARYKSSKYAQELCYGSVDRKMLQRDVGGNILVTLNQITDKCVYKDREISMDYDVAFRKFW